METQHTSLSNPQLKAMLLLVADRIIEAEPLLSEADRNLGDGDHGLGMQRGMLAAKVALTETPDDAALSDYFTKMGTAMMSAMGGASGVIFGTFFRAGGRALKGYFGNFDSRALAMVLAAAKEMIMEKGGARPGDKTMLDALAPARVTAAEAAGLPLHDALAQVAAAAEAGRDASKDMVATMGRAKTLGERSLGFPDAGACSVAIILRTMADYVNSAAVPAAA